MKGTLVRNITAALTLTLLVLSLATGCAKKEAAPAKTGEAAKAADARHVETVTVKTAEFKSFVEATGTALPVRESILTAEVPGRVEKFLAHRGDHVKQGQALVQFDTRSYVLGLEQAQAAQAAAKAAADLAKIEIDRISKLLQSDATAKATYDRVKAQYDASVAQHAQAEAAVKTAQKAVSDCTLRAPYAGTIVAELIQMGEYAPSMPPSPLMKIVDASKLDVQVNLPEAVANLVKKGDKADVAIDSAGTTLSGEIVFISDRIDQGTQTFEARVRLDNEQGAVKAGAFCRVRLARADIPDAILVPTRAISRDSSGTPSVFVLRNGKAERAAIQLGVSSGEQIHVTDGLKAGDEVITSQINSLMPGDAVQADNQG